MKHRLIVVGLLALSVAACQQPSRAQVVSALSDAKWGLAEACSQEWVPATECTIGLSAFDTTTALVSQVPADQAADAVKKTLAAVEDALPADSRLRPYLDVVEILLAAVAQS